MEVKEIEFAKLRHAYIIVKAFIDNESLDKVNSLDTKIENDLGITGDDALDLLQKFIAKFELDHKDFNFSKHFLSESEIGDPTVLLLALMSLSVWLPLKTIELISLNKIKLDKPNWHTGPERADLTFKDMITWYIEKDFTPSGDVKYVIKKAQADT